MLDMQIVRAPLAEADYNTILTEYNRLTFAGIPMKEFLRWVLKSPAGPAWHALLTNEGGRIVGHTSVLAIPAQREKKSLTTAMSEYSWVHEEFRKQKIRGYENVSRPPFIILLDALFQHCLKQGWGPLFASTNEKNQVFTRKVGLRPAEFLLKECLLVLRPSQAARRTPNLSAKQRSALFAVGVLQSSVWSIRPYPRRSNGVHEVSMNSNSLRAEPERLCFYEQSESLEWRYMSDQYVRYAFGDARSDYVIVKRGSPDRYARVCQYRLTSADSVNSLVRQLLERAKTDKAMGIRWAVYQDGNLSEAIVQRLRRLAFLCPDRVRILMIHKDFPEYLQPAAWSMSDSHFCFDP
jgi:hypothetical protein